MQWKEFRNRAQLIHENDKMNQTRVSRNPSGTTYKYVEFFGNFLLANMHQINTSEQGGQNQNQNQMNIYMLNTQENRDLAQHPKHSWPLSCVVSTREVRPSPQGNPEQWNSNKTLVEPTFPPH